MITQLAWSADRIRGKMRPCLVEWPRSWCSGALLQRLLAQARFGPRVLTAPVRSGAQTAPALRAPLTQLGAVV